MAKQHPGQLWLEAQERIAAKKRELSKLTSELSELERQAHAVQERLLTLLGRQTTRMFKLSDNRVLVLARNPSNDRFPLVEIQRLEEI